MKGDLDPTMFGLSLPLNCVMGDYFGLARLDE